MKKGIFTMKIKSKTVAVTIGITIIVISAIFIIFKSGDESCTSKACKLTYCISSYECNEDKSVCKSLKQDGKEITIDCSK